MNMHKVYESRLRYELPSQGLLHGGMRLKLGMFILPRPLTQADSAHQGQLLRLPNAPNASRAFGVEA